MTKDIPNYPVDSCMHHPSIFLYLLHPNMGCRDLLEPGDVDALFKYCLFLIVVQHECIPQAILGMDILCQAKSGMGKTAVFVLATLQQIEPVDGQVRYLLVKKLIFPKPVFVYPRQNCRKPGCHGCSYFVPGLCHGNVPHSRAGLPD